jgi:hypothetical protein
MRDQKIDWEHSIALYHAKEKDVRDKVIGSVKDVEFTGGKNVQWTITPDKEKAPFIRGLGVVFKETQGVAKSFGQHMIGGKKLTVSMEANWPLEDSGFAIALNGGKPSLSNDSPQDFVKSGFEYVSYAKAPPELQACYSRNNNRIQKTYQGRRVAILMGGLGEPIHFAGLAVCNFGAEKEAKIARVCASADAAMLKNFLFFKEALSGWSSSLEK